MRKLLVLTLLGACGLTALALRADTYHDQPDAKATGGITGQVQPAKDLQTVVAVEPNTLKCYQAQVDGKTGQFAFRGMVPGEYDLLIKTVGKVYEGVTLELEPDTPAPGPAEMKALTENVTKTYWTLEDYFNLKKIVRLTGTAEKARMLTVQTRTKHVVTPGAEKINAHIRRIDVVEMQKTGKVWQLANSRHLLRQEVPYNTPDSKVEFVHVPKLGGLLVGQNVKNLGILDLEKLPRGAGGKYASAEYAAKD